MTERIKYYYLKDEFKHMKNVIYLIIYPNNKLYIGQTTMKLDRRIKEDHSVIKSNPKNSKDIDTLTINEFVVDVLCQCDDVDELNDMEQYYIKLFDTTNIDIGYNIRPGGSNLRGYTLTEDQREHFRNVWTDDKKREWSEYCKNNPSKGFLGKKHSTESKNKMSESNKGRIGNHTRVKSLPDNIIFNTVKQCIEYYKLGPKMIFSYLDLNKIHKGSGQTFIRVE